MAAYRGRVEAPTSSILRTRHGVFEVFKTGFWGQGPVLLQALALLQGYDLEAMGHNSAAYVHTVAEVLKLALADRDAHYGDPDLARIPAAGLLSDAYAAERRKLIDPSAASDEIRPGNPWKFEPRSSGARPARPPVAAVARARATPPPTAGGDRAPRSPDTTTIDAADARGNLFSASPSSAWFFDGVFIAGDTGVPLGNRMQAFVLNENSHPNLLRGGKRPRTTLTPTVVLRDGRPFVAFSSPGGDSQDQQALQILLNLAVFGMRPQSAIEAPRFNSLHHHKSFGGHSFGDKDGRPNVLQVENRIAPETVEALRRLGHRVDLLGPFMLETGTALAGFDPEHGTVFGAADVRRQRFATGW
jgi:gamma-glutamyltranspeptidase/glutathione hydrolase